MSSGDHLLVGFLAFAAAIAVFRIVPALRLYLRFRGKRIVSCQEAKKAAAARVSAGKAAL